ncbi:MAG: transcriptional repressor [Robiginitomaculum sp.]|nr:MAG: transcriptional repressor [Robiginitomaculum sp.]
MNERQQQSLMMQAGLRITDQRLALSALLFADEQPRHVTAEEVYDEAKQQGVRMSLATVYNTLHRFTAAGLLREVQVDPGRVWFDTNVSEHHHMYDEDTGQLTDIPAGSLGSVTLPKLKANKQVNRIDLVIRIGTRN